MAWGSRILGRVVVGGLGLLLAGCVSGGTANLGGLGASPLAKLDDAPPWLARSQVPEPGGSNDTAKPAMVLPNTPANLLPSGNPLITPAAATISPKQAAALIEGSKVRVKVRAWVNGVPIFDDELMYAVGPMLVELGKLPEPDRSEKVAKTLSTALEHIIDQEVMYQDVIKKLKKGNPKALTKLKEMANEDYEKRLKKMREAGVSEDAIREFGHTAHRYIERDRLATEYARNRIIGQITARVTHKVIQSYYEAHKNEFQTVDKVQWQDVFIAVGSKHATPADARRFAEELVVRWQGGEDFAKIQEHDDGDSKFRGGEGYGNRRGEVRPPELEAHLFELKDGQFGPLVELATGVHIFRLMKREYAGMLPMNEQVQKQIKRKLESEIAEPEYNQSEARAACAFGHPRD